MDGTVVMYDSIQMAASCWPAREAAAKLAALILVDVLCVLQQYLVVTFQKIGTCIQSSLV
jgi:hypothetical protein